jgi:hypothetical protein
MIIAVWETRFYGGLIRLARILRYEEGMVVEFWLYLYLPDIVNGDGCHLCHSFVLSCAFHQDVAHHAPLLMNMYLLNNSCEMKVVNDLQIMFIFRPFQIRAASSLRDLIYSHERFFALLVIFKLHARRKQPNF